MDETKYTKFTSGGKKREDSFWNIKYNFEKENKRVIQ